MEQLKQLIKAVIAGDQNAMSQFLQIIEDPNQGPQVVQAVQSLAEQGDPDAQQLVQMLQGGEQPMKAKLGGKLRTIATLKNICPEGYELKTFKVGGKICKKCMKKAENGMKVKKETKPKDAAAEYKENKKAKGEDKAEIKKIVKKNKLGGAITKEIAEAFYAKCGGKMKDTKQKKSLTSKKK